MATYNAIKYNVDYGGFAGSLIPIATFTSDGSDSNATFTSGIDSTYEEYLFIFNNIHPQTDNRGLRFIASTDGGSNYGVATTSTAFQATHGEGDAGGALAYNTEHDAAQSTSAISLISEQANDSDLALSGYMRLYNPASTTFVKHFMCVGTHSASGGGGDDAAAHRYIAGYINTTSAVNAIKFDMQSGEIQGGTIQMFGVH
jgi:hypothetical protein